jgi:hypothetical protein
MVCPALNYVLTLTISLHNSSKFKATGNLCLTKARIVKITPFSSLSQVPYLTLRLDNKNSNDLLT